VLGGGDMGFQLSEWSDRWDQFVKWMTLQWDEVEGRPRGLLSVIWDGIDGMSNWVQGNSHAGFAILLAIVILISGRMLRRRR
jgi:hypothetical protein